MAVLESPRVLRTPGWPRGYCPVHAREDMPCSQWCIQTRVEFADAAADLDEYWEREDLSPREDA